MKGSNGLFRQEALSSKKERLWGDVLLTQPLSYKLILVGIVCAVIAVVALLLVGEYSRREIVRGYIVPDKGIVKVFPASPGHVSELLVSEGQSINAGEPLANIYTGRGNSTGSDLSQLLAEQLNQQRVIIEQKIDEENKLLTSEHTRLTTKLRNLKQENEIIRARIDNLGKRKILAEGQLENIQSLGGQGFAANNQVEEKQDQLLFLLSDIQMNEQSLVVNQSQIDDTKALLEQLPHTTAKSLSDLTYQLSQIEQRLLEVEGQNAYALKSPVDGRVSSIQVVNGENISGNRPILTILPKDAVLQAELFLPSRAIGFVDKEQEVLIRFDAFPYQRFGTHAGKVIDVAETISLPEELPVPVPLEEPVYRVRVELSSQVVKAYGKELSLQTGMLLDADIILEKRSIFEWLLEPLYSLRGRL